MKPIAIIIEVDKKVFVDYKVLSPDVFDKVIKASSKSAFVRIGTYDFIGKNYIISIESVYDPLDTRLLPKDIRKQLYNKIKNYKFEFKKEPTTEKITTWLNQLQTKP